MSIQIDSSDEEATNVVTIPSSLALPSDVAAAYGLSFHEFLLLCSLDAPVGFFNILYVLQTLFQGSDRAQELRCVDGYAGAANQVFTNDGFPSAA